MVLCAPYPWSRIFFLIFFFLSDEKAVYEDFFENSPAPCALSLASFFPPHPLTGDFLMREAVFLRADVKKQQRSDANTNHFALSTSGGGASGVP